MLEPASVAPSLLVFALEGYDLDASVRALAEVASGLFETESKDKFSLFLDGFVFGTNCGAVAASSH